MKKLKFLLMALIVLMTIKGAMAFYVSDNFNDNNISSTNWVNQSRTNLKVNEITAVIQFNGTNTTNLLAGGEAYLQSKQYIDSTQNGTAIATIEIENLAGANDAFLFGLANHTQGIAWLSTPPTYCGIYFLFRNGALTVAQNYPTAQTLKTIAGGYDGDPHELRIDVARINASNITSYTAYYDGVFQVNRNQTSVCDAPQLNATFASGGTMNGNLITVWVDDFSLYSSAGEGGDCVEPCIKNESFDYSDSVCNHNGWVAGDCNDLNTPVNGQYICNGSSQVLAKYFGKITKNSGLLTFSYDLEIKSTIILAEYGLTGITLIT